MNKNTREYLSMLQMHVEENLRKLGGSPSVQMQEIPPDHLVFEDAGAAEEDHPDPERFPQHERDAHIERGMDVYGEPHE